MAAQGRKTTHACTCLNVKIQPLPVLAEMPYSQPDDSEYSLVFVGEDGILVEHAQLTFRTRLKRVPLPDQPSHCTRYITLSCLICDIVVYRVKQTASLDVDGKDGPLLPTDDWIETETLKCKTGWIEVHKDRSVAKDDSHPPEALHSETFSLFIPSPTVSLDDHLLVPEPNRAKQELPSNSLPVPGSFSLHLRPLFLPPAFSPSHPLFTYISSVALNKSQVTRTAAEEYITDMIKAKVAEVEQFENQLRNEVDMLWRCSKATIDQQRKNDSANPSPSRHRENKPGPRPGPVTVRNFVPTSNLVPRPAPANSAPRISHLSVSLTNSGFYHPAATAEYSSSSPSHPSGSSLLDSSPRSLSTTSSLSSHLSARPRLNGGANLFNDPFQRDMDQAKDLATSLKYFSIEQEMQKPRPAAVTPQVPNVKSAVPPKEAMVVTNGIEKPTAISQPPPPETTSHAEQSSTHLRNGTGKVDGKVDTPTLSGQQGSNKGKRKVTFDVEPTIVTIATDTDGEKEEEEAQKPVGPSGEMVFDLEEGGSSSPSPATDLVLTLTEPIPPRRSSRTSPVRRPKRQDLFSSLLPASLPLPSHVRAPDSLTSAALPAQPSDSSNPIASAPRKKKGSPPPRGAWNPRPRDQREAELRKLVAADTPSHRGAWNHGSKAWELFVRRRSERAHVSSMSEEDIEEDEEAEGDDEEGPSSEDDEVDYAPDVAESLPVPIIHTPNPASYQSKLEDQIAEPGPSSHGADSGRAVSAEAVRRAAYAERNLSRSMDPGALDFDTDEVDDKTEEEDDDEQRSEVGQRGRAHALKILQARNELPGEGMWRSLAS